MSRDGAYYPPDVLCLSKTMERPGRPLQQCYLMDEVQQQIASLPSDLGMPARAEDRYLYELLAPVMVHIASSPITLSVACWGMAELK